MGPPKPFWRCEGWWQLDSHIVDAVFTNGFNTFLWRPSARVPNETAPRERKRASQDPPGGGGSAHSRGPAPPQKTSKVPRGGPGPSRGFPGPQNFAKNGPFSRTSFLLVIFAKSCISLGKPYVLRRVTSKTDFPNVPRASRAPWQGLGGALVALRLTFEPSLEFVNARVRLAVFRVRGGPLRKTPFCPKSHISNVF